MEFSGDVSIIKEMRMQIVIGCSQQDLDQAQWELIQQLEHILLDHHRQRELQQQIRAHWPTHAASPKEWILKFGNGLLSLFEQAQEHEDLRRETANLRYRCNRQERWLQEYRDDPLQARVKRLREERDRWQARAQDRAARIETLEQQLAAVRKRRQQDITRLKDEITHLNEIVVRQQEALGHERT
jgi:septin family protein